MKFIKSLLTTFLTFYLSISPIKAQEQKPKEILINKKKYSLLEDKVINEHNIIIKDKKTLLKVLKTNQIQEEINSLQINPRVLKFLELYAKGQELTMKYNEHIDWTLRLPSKILANITLGQKTTLEDLAKEVKDLTIDKLKETAKDVAENPEKQLKHLAYEYFAQSNEKAKFNLTILKTKQKIDYKTAVKFENNGYFINTFIKPSQVLYHDVENLRKLEERWVQTFLQEINDSLPEETDKITDLLLQKYEDIIQKRLEQIEPYEKFQKAIQENKQNNEKIKLEKEKELEKRVKKLLNNLQLKEDKIQIIFQMKNEEGCERIYIIDEDGTNLRELLPKPQGYKAGDCGPRVSPNQEEIFFNTTRGKQRGLVAAIFNLENKKIRYIHKIDSSLGSSFKWSPDSKKLIFKEKEDLFIINSDGTNLENITNTPNTEECNPKFSPTGKEIAYTIRKGTYKDPEYEIWLMNKNGENKRKLSEGENVEWSPKGDKLLFTYKENLYTINPNGEQKRIITPEKNVYYYGVWSPKGDKIFCVREEDPWEEIYSMNPDGTNKTNITNHPRKDGDPHISSKGEKMIFCSRREDREWNIYIMDLNNKNVKKLVKSREGKGWVFNYNINIYQPFIRK